MGEGIAPESDIAVFAILYDPARSTRGGVVEALGVGMDFRDGDLAYRVNFATAEWPTIVDRRVGRDLTSEESAALAEEVNEKLSLPDATFELRATVEHRGVLVIRSNEGRSRPRSRTPTPPTGRKGTSEWRSRRSSPSVARCEPLDDTPAARLAAELTNAFVEGSARILDASDVNTRAGEPGSSRGT